MLLSINTHFFCTIELFSNKVHGVKLNRLQVFSTCSMFPGDDVDSFDFRKKIR